MRDEQHADAAFELVDGVGKAFSGVLVQRAGGFVEDQYFGALARRGRWQCAAFARLTGPRRARQFRFHILAVAAR